MKKYEFDVRQVDAWVEDLDDNGKPIWYWNNSYHIDTIRTNADDIYSVFRRWFRRATNGRTTKDCYIRCDGDVYEMCRKEDDAPFLALVPML